VCVGLGMLTTARELAGLREDIVNTLRAAPREQVH
jgi:hypothetical protein